MSANGYYHHTDSLLPRSASPPLPDQHPQSKHPKGRSKSVGRPPADDPAIPDASPDLTSREEVRQSNRAAQSRRRSKSNVRAAEQAANTAAHKSRRTDPDARATEQAADTAARQSRRSDPDARATEQAADTAARQSRRSDPSNLSRESARRRELRAAATAHLRHDSARDAALLQKKLTDFTKEDKVRRNN